jgi:hypothetical protein
MAALVVSLAARFSTNRAAGNRERLSKGTRPRSAIASPAMM